jgi:hypothetical protein
MMSNFKNRQAIRMGAYDDLPPMMRAVTEMHLTGNIVPDAWFKRIVTGKVRGSETGGLV